MAHGRLVCASILPRGDVREFIVVAKSLAVGGLIFLAEVAATGFVPRERIHAHEFAEL
jgi:hypothetical protein